jgi:hypothetical protein
LGRTGDTRYLNDEERLKRRKAILTALAKATEDSTSLEEMAANGDDIKNDYYTLTQDEMEALISGDMQKIENWVSSLDRRHAIWLLCKLIKEKW